MADIFFDGELHNDKLKELMGKMHKMKSEQLMLDV